MGAVALSAHPLLSQFALARMNLLSRLFGRRKTERVEFTTLGQQPAPKPDPDLVALLLRDRDTLRQQLKQSTAKVQFTPGRDFVAVFPFHQGDYARFVDLMRWMWDLDGGRIQGTALLVAPFSMDRTMLASAESYCPFETIRWISTPFDLPKEGWPTGTCWSFLTAAEYCRRERLDFWLNEPDCIPLKAGWFESIRAEYRACGRPYMGFIEPATNDYPRHLTGNAAYHHGVFHHFRADKLGTAWDIAMADVLTPLAHATPLFHQEFGPLDRPPTFHTVDDLRRIPKEAMVFHRNKDGSLIRVLREQRKMQAGSGEQGAGNGGAK